MDRANRPEQPLVSVLIPTYNYARYLDEAIQSVLGQDYPHLEIIISDDASTDRSADIIRRYANSDPRIRCHFQQSNLGMIANWNWCLARARGRYIKFLFGDDRLETRSAVSRLVDMLEDEPTATIAASARHLIDHASQAAGLWNDLRRPGRIDGHDAILACLRRTHNLIGEPSAVLFRRTAALRGFSPAFRQLVDLEMWFHLLLQGDLVYTPEPLCAFRQHHAQQTQANQQHGNCTLELPQLVTLYCESGELRRSPRFSRGLHRKILFRTLRTMEKNARRHPHLVSSVRAWSRQLPPHWRAYCWLTHRLTRPWENLHRAWRKRLDRAALRPAPTLLNSLPAD